jgi:surface carbohydrate biosynthesis protein (TIGR04326 family)
MCPLEPLLSAPPAFRYEVIETPLPALWAQAERAVTANSTAAAIEGLYLGLPVAVCLAGDAMNMSPLWQEAGVPMIGDAPALVRFLQSGVAAEIPTNYFLLDRDLPSWRRLLAV